jgi:hypothetical protein
MTTRARMIKAAKKKSACLSRDLSITVRITSGRWAGRPEHGNGARRRSAPTATRYAKPAALDGEAVERFAKKLDKLAGYASG